LVGKEVIAIEVPTGINAVFIGDCFPELLEDGLRECEEERE
jgi:hypothetical protein